MNNLTSRNFVKKGDENGNLSSNWPKIQLSSEIKKNSPNLVIGVIFAEVNVEKKINELWDKFNLLCNSIKMQINDIVNLEDVKAIRQSYIKFGKDPSKYRGSAEALLRRISQGKSLYQINNIVDINNYISVKSNIPCGVYNIEKLNGDTIIRIGKKGEQYKGIGKEMINIENLPLFADNNGPFGSPTSDSERAMITQDTKKIMLFIISFGGNKDGKLNSFLDEGIELLQKYANGINISQTLIY